VTPDPSTTVSRQLLHLHSSMVRRQAAPQTDEDVHERAILLLQAFLRQHCPPFVAALPPAVPQREKLVADIKPGLVCVQWYVADLLFPCHASCATHHTTLLSRRAPVQRRVC
jgi:hypothetical protein